MTRTINVLTYTVEARGSFEEAEKCAHNDGQWCIIAPQTRTKAAHLRVFDPPTPLQKDIWLRASEYASDPKRERDRRLAILRWICRQCGTVQKP